MKRVIASAVVTVLLLGCTAVFSFAQEEAGKITLRTLPVDWYEISGDGVKVMYRTFNDDPVTLYLPSSFERKFFRFVDTPKEYGGANSLPFMLVHMQGQEVLYIDIYTRFMRTDARIAKYGKEDLENFKAQEQKGKIEVKLF